MNSKKIACLFPARTAAVLVGLSLAWATLASAEVSEYDGFDYTGTALDGQNGGTGWGGAWANTDGTATLSNDGISLTFPLGVTHTPVGSRVVFSGAGQTERRVGTSMPLNTDTAYYFSALVKRQGSFKVEFMDDSSNVRWRFGGLGDATTNTAVAGISSDTLVNDVFPVDETVFIVGKLQARTATSPGDSAYLNIYRSSDTVPLAEPSTWQVSGTQNSGVTLTRLQVRNISDLPLELDEVYVGTNWLDVAIGPVAGVPLIARQPDSATVYPGEQVTLSAEAVGQEPLSYQWSHDGTPVLNATNTELTLVNVQSGDAGNYTLTVTNSAGSATSDPATLQVIPITDISTGQEGLWHFDETSGLVASDSSGNGNNGTLGNFPAGDSQWVSGVVNNALAFGGSNYVEVANSATIGPNLANHFSVATWINSRVTLSTGGDAYRAMEKEGTFFLLQGNGNTNSLGVGGMNVLVKKGGANLSVSIGQALEANRWYHLAATYNGTTLSIYLNGELRDSREVPAPLDSTTLPLHIGSDYSTGTMKFLNGIMDEVGIWERALTPAEVGQLVGPLVIEEQPQNQTKYAGSTAVFQVSSRGVGPFHYLWFHGTEEIRSATSNVLTLVNVQASDAGDYFCRVSNASEQVDSATATLTVVPVTDLMDGVEAFWHFDETSGFTAVDASDQARDGELTDYVDPTSQWVPGEVNNALNYDGQSNRVVVGNSQDIDLSTDATFAFWIRPAGYGTLQDTGNYTLNTGRIMRKGSYFDVETVDDPGSVRATIRFNGVGATQNILALNEWQHFTVVYRNGTVTFFKNGFQVGDPVTAPLGSVNTNLLVLGNFDEGTNTFRLFDGDMDEVGIWARPLSDEEILSLAGRDVSSGPVIVTQPQSATRYAGDQVSFLVEATGKRPLTYQWQHDGVAIPDSDTNLLVLTNLVVADGGNYTVTVQNDLGTDVSSPPAVLVVQEITGLTTGLIAYWPFDETSGTVFHDASGNGHDAALQNGSAVTGTLGIVGSAYDFDGVDDFAIVPNAPDLNLYHQATFSVWINPRTYGVANSGGIGRIIRKDINYDFTIYEPTASIRFYGINKATYDAPNGSVTLNEWQQLAVVINNGTIQFFRNGRALANPIPGLLGPAITNDLIIANFGPDLSINRIFNGYMDELGMWDRALTPAEIDGIYQNGLAGKPLNAPLQPLHIESINVPAPGQVRLVFSSPFTGRGYDILESDQIDAPTWTNLTSVSFSDLGGGTNEAVFAQPEGHTAFYRVVLAAPSAIYTEDFETGAPGWTHGGDGDNWELGTPVNGPGAAFSGANVYATSLTGNVNPYSDCYLRSPAIDLTGVSRATLTFEQWRNVDPDPTYHGCIVNVLDASNNSLIQQLSLQSGSSSGWELTTLPLPQEDLNRSIILEFRLYCDAYNLLEGWYIDDVNILPE